MARRVIKGPGDDEATGPVAVGPAVVAVGWDPVWGRAIEVTGQTVQASKPLPPLKPFRKAPKTTVAQLKDRVRAEMARKQELFAEERARAEKRMALAASEKRLGKEIRGYYRLDQINKRGPKP